MNDEHTHHCHNLKLDQHHLFVPVGQKELHALPLLDGGDGFLDGGFGGFGPVVCSFAVSIVLAGFVGVAPLLSKSPVQAYRL